MSGKSALITGIEGQDGSYLAEYLLELGYQVYGTMRPGGSATNIRHLLDRITLRSIDISDVKILGDLVIELGPLEIYHLAGPSFVGDSDVDAASKLQAIVTSTYALLEAAANSDLPPRARCLAIPRKRRKPRQRRSGLDRHTDFPRPAATKWSATSGGREASGAAPDSCSITSHHAGHRGSSPRR